MRISFYDLPRPLKFRDSISIEHYKIDTTFFSAKANSLGQTDYKLVFTTVAEAVPRIWITSYFNYQELVDFLINLSRFILSHDPDKSFLSSFSKGEKINPGWHIRAENDELDLSNWIESFDMYLYYESNRQIPCELSLETLDSGKHSIQFKLGTLQIKDSPKKITKCAVGINFDGLTTLKKLALLINSQVIKEMNGHTRNDLIRSVIKPLEIK